MLITLFLLLLAVAIHEYGHYLVMRRNGVTVVEFSVGIGPILWERRLKSGTKFQLRAIPLGGYAMPVQEGAGSMQALSGWARWRIYMAGMFMNALSAFVTLLAVYCGTGKIHAIAAPFVHWAPVWARPVAGAAVMSFGLWLAGPFLLVKLAIVHGLAFFTHDVSGPIGIVAQGANITRAGGGMPVWAKIADMFALIHIGLAMFNLLPIMPLDGGQIARDLVRKFFGEKASMRFATYGTFLMIAFFLFIIGSDVVKTFFRAAR